MARTADKIVKWLYQNPDQSLIWSWVSPDYYPKNAHLVAFGWKYGKVTWVAPTDKDDEDNA